MPRKSLVVVDVIWEFRMSKQSQISTEAARGNLILDSKQIQSKTDGSFYLNVIQQKFLAKKSL